MYNFDKVIDREGTSSVKYGWRDAYFGNANVLPMWVADMDFESPDFVREAIQKRTEHPIFGYSIREEPYFKSIIDWVKRRHHWDIEKEWILQSPGIVPALNFSVLAYTEPGDGIIVQPPVYFPFFSAVKDHQRVLLENELVFNGESYHINFEEFEQLTKKAKMFFLSSPHNPVGKCFTKDELTRMAEICLANEVVIISDEIHNDLILPGFSHIPLASISEEISNITVSCIAPSKTFNLAGLSASSVIISSEDLRNKFSKILNNLHIANGNLFGAVAMEAAYNHGDQWLDQLMVYIEGNFNYLDDFLKNEIPNIQLVKPQSTYLGWINFRKTGLTDKQIKDKLIHKAGLGFSHGPVFGKGGEGFQRINVAAPRSVVEEAMDRLKAVFG